MEFIRKGKFVANPSTPTEPCPSLPWRVALAELYAAYNTVEKGCVLSEQDSKALPAIEGYGSLAMFIDTLLGEDGIRDLSRVVLQVFLFGYTRGKGIDVKPCPPCTCGGE